MIERQGGANLLVLVFFGVFFLNSKLHQHRHFFSWRIKGRLSFSSFGFLPAGAAVRKASACAGQNKRRPRAARDPGSDRSVDGRN
jgi:hypothetical protein